MIKSASSRSRVALCKLYAKSGSMSLRFGCRFKRQAKPAGSGRKAGSHPSLAARSEREDLTPRHASGERGQGPAGRDGSRSDIRAGKNRNKSGGGGRTQRCARMLWGAGELCVSAAARGSELSGIAGGPIMIDADPFDAITRELSRIAERSREKSSGSTVAASRRRCAGTGASGLGLGNCNRAAPARLITQRLGSLASPRRPRLG